MSFDNLCELLSGRFIYDRLATTLSNTHISNFLSSYLERSQLGVG
ncbi:hypothetical protein [Nostoc sp.]